MTTTEQITTNKPSEIFVLAGPNGAGKTTTAGILLPKTLRIEHFVNADLIAKGLSPFAPELADLDAGRLMLKRIRELRGKRLSFAFETTLAARTFEPFLRQAQEEGYLVHVIYIWLASVALALSRVADRVRQGGHHVPDAVVRRRYQRGLKNFFSLYEPLADTWTLCDNSGREPLTVAQGGRNRTTVVFHRERFDAIRWGARDVQ